MDKYPNLDSPQYILEYITEMDKHCKLIIPEIEKLIAIDKNNAKLIAKQATNITNLINIITPKTQTKKKDR